MDDTGEINYSFFKDKDLVLYSVCKKDGKLVEGFLEAELEKLVCDKEVGVEASRSFEEVLANANLVSAETDNSISKDNKDFDLGN